jgi:hypothetical protein
MTEDEWLVCTEPLRMLHCLWDEAGRRKLRLFACACCRRLLHPLTDERCRCAVEVAEQDADGSATPREVQGARNAVFRLRSETFAAQWPAAYGTASAAHFCMLSWEDGRAYVNAVHASLFARNAEDNYQGSWSRYLNAGNPDYSPSHPAQAALLRDVFGNPFRPVAVDASWLTPAVLGLARAIYDGRLFGDLPVLADALEEAGCRDTQILRHCRGRGPHVLGCWPLDLLLGKHHEPPEPPPPEPPSGSDEAPPF